ncbi:hypothetical protein O181_038240 [Austropuccinia psidii MF-1]|uniref:GAR domain-containing protein n=1 Tax=Austropuccinia psidii MF-1 TaxID=1389203 RepID=A0A9Q3D9H6_9BASI|nr:hypothetical protein [Austropuccinia psidii MF-1]
MDLINISNQQTNKIVQDSDLSSKSNIISISKSISSKPTSTSSSTQNNHSILNNNHLNLSANSKLDNQIIFLLEGLNKRKFKIDQKVEFLKNLPKINPFEPLPPNISNIDRKIWKNWSLEHVKIEREAEIFRDDEFALMKKVAMSKTTNMSREDTDLVGLTLGTLEAFSKLDHLLRSRRKQLEILDLRIKWDQQTKKIWKDLKELEIEQPKLLKKLRWSPPSLPFQSNLIDNLGPNQINSTPTSPHLSQIFNNILDSSIQNSLISKPSNSKIDSINSKLILNSSSDLIHPKFQTDIDQTNGELSNQSNLLKTSNSSHQSPSPPLISTNVNESNKKPYKRHSLNFTPSNSLRTSSSSSSSSSSTPLSNSFGSSSSSSPQSRAMRIQAITLQLSSITSKFHSINRAILPTSLTIDQLIDSGLHLPEIFLDEQDKLEAAVRALDIIETTKFFNQLIQQHKEADQVWFNLRNLEVEIETFRREINDHLNTKRIDQNHLNRFESRLGHFIKDHNHYHLRASLRISPSHPNFLDQAEINQLLIETLRGGSKRVVISLDRLKEWIKLYRLALEAKNSAQSIQSLLDDCKFRLEASISSLNQLNALHPQRPWLMINPDCLRFDIREKHYEKLSSEFLTDMKKISLEGSALLEKANLAFIQLNDTFGSDPSWKCQLHNSLDELTKMLDQAHGLIIDHQDSFEKLKTLRSSWDKLLQARIALTRLRDQLLLSIDLEKRTMRKISPDNFINTTQDLDNSTSLIKPYDRNHRVLQETFEEPNEMDTIISLKVLNCHQDALEYITQDLQPIINFILVELIKHNQHKTIHQYILQALDEILHNRLPDLLKIERTMEQIQLQARQVRDIESEYDANFIEGGRLMKKVQDLIGLELDQSYEDNDESVDPGVERPEMNRAIEIRRNRLTGQLSNYFMMVDQFCCSLVKRIKFIQASICSGTLALQSGRVVLDCHLHNEALRSHINALSMNLMGLKDQVSNELQILMWISNPHVNKFKTAIKDVKRNLQTINNQLDALEGNVCQYTHLFDSNVDESFLDDTQIESQLNQPLKELKIVLRDIENKFDQSTSLELETFISSCPSPFTSKTFKPDQFILPKQMLYHQLQSRYNQTLRRLNAIEVLCLKFVGQVNQKRKIELGWRKVWRESLEELINQCESFKAEIGLIEHRTQKLKQESQEWQTNRLEAREHIDLVQLEPADVIPDYLAELAGFESTRAGYIEMLEVIQRKIDGVDERTKTLGQEIGDRLPAFNHLTIDLTTMIGHLQNEWSRAHESIEKSSQSIIRIKGFVEIRLNENKNRLRWKNQCLEIAHIDLEATRQMIVTFDEALGSSVAFWCQLPQPNEWEGEVKIRKLDEQQVALLDSLRSITGLKSVNLASIKHNLELAHVKFLTINEEAEKLSKNQLPLIFLNDLEVGVNDLIKEFEERLKKLLNVENDLIERILLVNGLLDSAQNDRLEEAVMRYHYDVECNSLRLWNQTCLDPFVDGVEKEMERIVELRCSEVGESTLVQASLSVLPASSSSKRSTMSFENEDAKLEDKVAWVMNLLEIGSRAAERLIQLKESQVNLASQLKNFQLTLPSQCLCHLEFLIGMTSLEGQSRFKTSSDRLRELCLSLEVFNIGLRERLKEAEENLEAARRQKATLKVLLRIYDRLNGLGLESWLNTHDNTQHSPLPTETILVTAIETLDEVENELEELSKSTFMIDDDLLKKVFMLLDQQRGNIKILKALVAFQTTMTECDQTFSALLDILDDSDANSYEDEVKKLHWCARQALEALILTVTGSIEKDFRVEYHVVRLKQTWEELEAMVREVNKKEPDRYQHPNNVLSKSRIPVPMKFGTRLETESPASSKVMMNTPRSMPTRISSIRQLYNPASSSNRKFSPQFEASNLSSSPLYPINSPSYPISRRRSQLTPDPAKLQTKVHQPDSYNACHQKKVPERSCSRMSESRLSVSTNKNLLTQSLGTPRQRLYSIQATPPRPTAKHTEGLGGMGSASPVVYKPRPNRKIDKMIRNVVTRLAVGVHVAPADGWEDNSGMYWIGEKIYFCRILRSQTVMVRIGGGWSELSNFLLVNSKQDMSPNTGRSRQQASSTGPELWVTADQVRRATNECQFTPCGAQNSAANNWSPLTNTSNTSVNGGEAGYFPLTPGSNNKLAITKERTTSMISVSGGIRNRHRMSNVPNNYPGLGLSFSPTPIDTIQTYMRKVKTPTGPASEIDQLSLPKSLSGNRPRSSLSSRKVSKNH